MKLQQVKQLIREEVRRITKSITIKELGKKVINKNIPSERDADIFINQVLKLGSKDNLFDKYMRRKEINPDELSTLVGLVANRLNSKWAGK